MQPNTLYQTRGIIFGHRSIDLGKGKTIDWMIGGLALNHLGNGLVVPPANNDNEEQVA